MSMFYSKTPTNLFEFSKLLIHNFLMNESASFISTTPATANLH